MQLTHPSNQASIVYAEVYADDKKLLEKVTVLLDDSEIVWQLDKVLVLPATC